MARHRSGRERREHFLLTRVLDAGRKFSTVLVLDVFEVVFVFISHRLGVEETDNDCCHGETESTREVSPFLLARSADSGRSTHQQGRQRSSCSTEGHARFEASDQTMRDQVSMRQKASSQGAGGMRTYVIFLQSSEEWAA